MRAEQLQYDNIRGRFVATAIGRFGALLTGIAPHAQTQRASYTVPTSPLRMANFGPIEVGVKRRTAPTVAGTFKCWFELGVVVANTEIIHAWHFTGDVAAGDHVTGMAGIWLPNTSVIEVLTQDGSTDGTVDYAYGFFAPEFAQPTQP